MVPSLFRSLEEDFTSMDNLFNNLLTRPAIRSFSPRFDVREEKDAFHLHGELPGVDAQNLQVEFVDRNTMVIRGRTVHESQRGNNPATTGQQQGTITQDKGKQKAIDSAPEQAPAAADAMETEPTSRPSTPASTSSSYRKATVEEAPDADNDFVDVQAETATPATTTEGANRSTATTTAAEPQQQPEQPQDQQASSAAQDTIIPYESTHSTNQPQKEQSGHYWVSERSIGEFSRSFRFPGHVDQEGVRAHLKDGVLSVVVPKLVKAEPRRIRIE